MDYTPFIGTYIVEYLGTSSSDINPLSPLYRIQFVEKSGPRFIGGVHFEKDAVAICTELNYALNQR